ncbi:SpoIIE family protein phosphatase [Amycolatopsis pigmentata]|uniref:histidine kinase n=1 Tax=Amycolatopsis pigmentata TaxID=450801 RepID=A0ABW5FSQ8_9PSEU
MAEPPAASHQGGHPYSPSPDTRLPRLPAEVDWTATPLGPVADWTPALRTTVDTCLSSPFPMLIMWGPELAMVYNEAFAPILGAKHPALGRRATEIWDDAWPVVGGMINSVLDGGEASYRDDLRLMLRRNGFDEEVYFTFAYSPVFEQDGDVGGVLTIVSETTHRVLGARRMEVLQELGDSRITRDDVRESCETSMEVLAGHRADLPFGAIYLLDDEHAHAVAGYGVPGTVGLPAGLADDEWILRAITMAEPVTRDGLAPVLGVSAPESAGGGAVDTAVALPLAVAGQEKAGGALVLGVSPHLALDEGYRGFLDLVARQVASAVNDAKAYAAERRRAEDLAELDRAKTRFFTGVSHELRTPLALISGPAEDALADTANPLTREHRQRMEIIHRNAGRLTRLVDTLLDFHRIEDGQLRPEPGATELGELTRGIAESFAPAVARAGLEFTIDCPSGDRPVLTDRDMWEKILLNLLSNAVKYTMTGEVRVSLRIADGEADLRVSDTGVGIPAEELPALFQRFHQVRGVTGRSHEGSGIGLALVRELARLLGGDVEASSRPGEGSTFAVRIPVREAGGAAAEAEEPVFAGRQAYVDEARQWATGVTSAPEPGTGADRILVAEDNADLRRYLSGLLEPSYEVTVASNGDDALDQVRRRRPDLILADIMMPGIDGFAFLRALRADSSTAGIPVIFLSARAGEDSAIEGLAAGADDYLVKPFSSAELMARVRSNLDLARVRNHESAWRKALLNSMQDGFFVATASGTVVEINDAFTEVLGYPAGELPLPLPHPWWPSEDDDPEGFAHVSATMERALRTGRGRWVLPLHHRDGRNLWVNLAIDALGEGEHRLIVGTLRDVTAEHVAAERDAALARLAGRLTGIEDAERILEVGLSELRDVWQAARVSTVAWQRDGNPVVTATTDPARPSVRDFLPDGAEESTRTGRILTAPIATPDGDPVTGIGAPISDEFDLVLVWLEFSGRRPFPAAERALLVQLCAHLQRALGRARAFDDQRKVALTLQRSLLGPAGLPDAFAVRYEPASATLEVGGDWYDVVSLPSGRYGVVVGDVVGRGLPAATVMGQLRSAARALLLENNSPAEVLTALDRFSTLIPAARCCTVFCAVVDSHGHTANYSSAGHLPALLAHPDGTVRRLDEAQSLPLSVRPEVGRPEANTELPAGSTLLLYTDGLVERRRELIDLGIGRAATVLTESAERPPEDIADDLAARLLAGDHEDDVAFLIYRQPSTPAPLARSFPAEPRNLAENRRALRVWLGTAGADADTVNDLLVAVNEAVTNAIEHAYRQGEAGSVHVEADLDTAGVLRIAVRDNGRWLHTPSSPAHRGRGLTLMRALTDNVDVVTGTEGTAVRLTRRIAPEALSTVD